MIESNSFREIRCGVNGIGGTWNGGESVGDWSCWRWQRILDGWRERKIPETGDLGAVAEEDDFTLMTDRDGGGCEKGCAAVVAELSNGDERAG